MILPGDAPESIATAARFIRAGGLLGLPTETVYGLAADADNDAAVAQIFVAKGRPADHPLIVHVASAAAVAHYACDVPDFATPLMAAFWPGPLTLILPRRPGVANAAASGNPTIGLRCPAHPVAQALLNWGQIPINSLNRDFVTASEALQSRQSEVLDCITSFAMAGVSMAKSEATRQSMPAHLYGVAAPSANQFGRVSPTTAQHVQDEFGDALLVLDGGSCRVGIESTIIDCTRGVPVLLRPGAISTAQVQAACGIKVLLNEELPVQTLPKPKASGTLDSHYAPRARVRLLDAAALQTALNKLQNQHGKVGAAPAVAVWSRTALAAPAAQAIYQTMPSDAALAAQQLFATLRALDDQGVAQIWVETPPPVPDWDGVRDRLQRAAH